MDEEQEIIPELGFSVDKNEFTGSLRESLEPPAENEPICLISFEITHILLGDGPKNRKSFWKMYRRELKFNRDSNYQNYHVRLCQHQLSSLRMDLSQPVYFRKNRLRTEKQLDAYTVKALAGPCFDVG